MRKLIFLSLIFLIASAAKAQKDNPYKLFGYEGKVVDIDKTQLTRAHVLYNKDTAHPVKKIIFDNLTKQALLYGHNDSIVESLAIPATIFLRWLSTDPMKAKFPSASPYGFVDNSPIMYKDENGDSSVYVNEKGDVLFVSHDQLENAVITISNAELENFKSYLAFMKTMGAEDNDTGNEFLREYGKSYMVGEYWSFYKKNENDVYEGDYNKYKDLVNEHGTYLYDEDGEVRIGEEDFQGDPGYVVWGKAEDWKNVVAKLHTHPNSEKTVAGPSRHDKATHWYNKKGYYNIVVEKDEIYFYNSTEGENFSVNKNIFQKK